MKSGGASPSPAASSSPRKATSISALNFSFTWNSEPGKIYGINWGFDLTTWDFDISDDIASQGTTTTYPALEEPAEPNPGATPDGPPKVIFFRVEEQPAP